MIAPSSTNPSFSAIFTRSYFPNLNSSRSRTGLVSSLRTVPFPTSQRFARVGVIGSLNRSTNSGPFGASETRCVCPFSLSSSVSSPNVTRHRSVPVALVYVAVKYTVFSFASTRNTSFTSHSPLVTFARNLPSAA